MRYLVGLVLSLVMVASPLNVSAQPAEEDSLGSWQKRAPTPASEEMAAPAAGRDPGALVAPQDKALVVFVRPGRYPVTAPAFPVYNATKNLLTFVGRNERAAIAVEPGRHTFYVVWRKNAELVRADVGAGRTYVIHTTPKFGVPGVVVVPIRRDLPQFAESAKWLHKAKVAKGYRWTSEQWTSEHQSSVSTAIAEAEAEWSRMDTKAQAARTMRVEDGRAQDEMVALGLAASTLEAAVKDDEERASFEQPAPEKPALELKLDDAGVEVAPTYSWPG